MFKERLSRFLRQSLTGLAVIILAGFVIFLGSKVQKKRKRMAAERARGLKEEQPLIQVITQELQGEILEDHLNLPAVISPWEDLLVRAEVDGRIINVPVQEGDLVTRGQVLARIDRRDYENQLTQAEAAYTLAKLEYDRFLKLSAMKAAPQAQLDASLAHLKETEANLASARLALERTTITAPIDGFMNRLEAKVGLLVSRSDPIAQILDTRRVKVEVGIPEADVRAIQDLKEAFVEVAAAGGKKFLGRNIFLSRQPDSSRRVYTMKLAVDNPANQLRPGMFARVDLIKHRYEGAIAIPLYAVIARGDERFVYIVQDGAARYRKIALGILDGWRVQVTEGLEPGEQVIIVGHRSLEDGQRVAVQKIVQDPRDLQELL
ncbi:MAG: efflux RND transporter periplasmic adaptor subunit [bacterium]